MEVSKKEKHEPVVIRIMDYDNLEIVLSKIIIPFSEVIKNSHIPDVYAGYEKIPFEKRYPLYKTILRQEFADAIRVLKTRAI
ncbi:MAG: hypothetical protein ACTSO6_08285 [Promethearchaeota archaeon]